MWLLPARAAPRLQRHQDLMLFLLHSGCSVLVIMHISEVFSLHEKNQPITNKANTQHPAASNTRTWTVRAFTTSWVRSIV